MTSDPSEHRRRLKTTLTRGLAAKEFFVSASAVSFAPGVVIVFGAAAMQGASPKMLLGQPLYLILAVFAFIAIIALNAHFVMAETALNLLKSSLVKAQDKSPDKMSDAQALEYSKLSHLLDFRDIYTAGAFMGSQTMRAWLFILCLIPAWAFEELLTPEPGVRGFSWIILWMILFSIPVAGLNVLFGELIPKSYASVHSTAVCVRLYGFIRLCAGLFTIPTRLSTWFAGLFTQKFGASASFALPNHAEEEIKTLIETYGESGHIEEEEIEMLDSVFEFGDSVAVEIMTPRVDLDSISCDKTIREAAEMIQQTGHSRLPVHDGTDDSILGIIHAKDVMQALLDGKADIKLSACRLRPAVPVPENKSLHDLLQEMRNSKTQLVIVQDDFGGTAGIVTIEDIVEEVMGDIVDEYDIDQEEVVESDGGYLVLGKLHLDDVNDECGTSFSSEDFDTLGGYVFGLFGRQPDQGESIEHGGWSFTVAETDGRRIVKVFIQSKAPENLAEQIMSV